MRVGFKGKDLAALEIVDSFGQRSLLPLRRSFAANVPVAAETLPLHGAAGRRRDRAVARAARRALQSAARRRGRDAISTAFVPPNANEFDIAWRSAGAAARRAGDQVERERGIERSRVLAVGGRRPRSERARNAASSSTAPPAPSRWPWIALVELTGTPSRPNTAASDSASAASPARVAVPWALR